MKKKVLFYLIAFVVICCTAGSVSSIIACTIPLVLVLCVQLYEKLGGIGLLAGLALLVFLFNAFAEVDKQETKQRMDSYYKPSYYNTYKKPNKETNHPYNSYSHKGSSSNKDSYNVKDYGDPEDFYDDYWDDFDNYEDAEDYYYDHAY